MNPYEPYWDGCGMSVGLRPKHILGRGRPYNRHAPSIDCASIDGNRLVTGRARGLMGGAFMGTLLAQQGGGGLPSNFREVYAVGPHSKVKCWINTGVLNDSAWSAHGSFRSIGSPSSAFSGTGTIVCAHHTDATWTGFGVRNSYATMRPVHGAAYGGTIVISSTDVHQFSISVSASGTDVTIGDTTRSVADTVEFNSEPIRVFQAYDSATSNAMEIVGRLTIVRAGETVAELVPCVKDGTKATFFDLISKQERPNLGAGAMTYTDFA